jgi:hypothetical protein
MKCTSVRTTTDKKWIRKVDGDMHVMPPGKQPQKRWYPGTLDELLCCIRHVHEEEGPVSEAKASGSHWAMSNASVTPGNMIETATPVHEKDGDQTKARLNKVLYDVIPRCLTPDAYGFFRRQQMVPRFDPKAPFNPLHNYIFHVEAGIRLHELYSYLDSGADGKDHRSLAWKIEQEVQSETQPPGTPPPKPVYLGPWALESMGGAGGQTIAGVASTSTHGGDLDAGAISDLVIAMHLVAPDGQEYWIERTQIRPGTIPLKLIDETELKKVYAPGPGTPGGTKRKNPIIYKRSDDLMNAALVSCGRMGVIYSVVLRAVRQYALEQKCEITKWHDVKKWLSNPAHPKFTNVFGNNRFVRLDVDVYPEFEIDWEAVALTFALDVAAGPVGLATGTLLGFKGNEYRAWIMTRNTLPLHNAVRTDAAGQQYYYGRRERSEGMEGKGKPLGKEDDTGYFSDPCGTDNVFRTELTRAIGDLSDIRNTAIEAWLIAGAVTILTPLAAELAAKAQAIALRTILFAQYWIFVLSAIRAMLPAEAKFGDVASGIMNELAALHAHSLIQVMYGAASKGEHPDPAETTTAISYSIMDEHNYQNIGCVAPGDSIDFFIDASKPLLAEFIDSALNAVRDLADDGKAFGGYISMRFMTESPSFLAMQRWKRTCAIEIAGLSRAFGTEPLIARLEEESRQRDIILHWGQRNRRSQKDIEKHFYPVPGGPLYKWRDVLSQISEHGRLANFSTEFTRYKGLEITQPRLYSLTTSLAEGCSQETTDVHYDAWKNPPGTTLVLLQAFEDGEVIARPLPDLKGFVTIPFGAGRSTLELTASRELNGRTYEAAPLNASLRGFQTGDTWTFQFTAELRVISGIQRWFVELNLFSESISNSLRVQEVSIKGAYTGGWVLRNAEAGDVLFAGTSETHVLPGLPVFNRNWQIFSQLAAAGTPPVINVQFRITC